MPKLNAAMPTDDYQAQSDARTMLEHHAIKSDKKRHAAALAHMRGKLTAMKAAMEGRESQATEKAETPGAVAAEKRAGIE
jgi:hypothetical protein